MNIAILVVFGAVLIGSVYGVFLILHVTRPWAGSPPRGLKQPPADKLRKCPGCGRKFHPSWGRACGDCSGAS